MRMRWKSWGGRGARHRKDCDCNAIRDCEDGVNRPRPVLGVLPTHHSLDSGRCWNHSTQFDPCQPTGTWLGWNCQCQRQDNQSDLGFIQPLRRFCILRAPKGDVRLSTAVNGPVKGLRSGSKCKQPPLLDCGLPIIDELVWSCGRCQSSRPCCKWLFCVNFCPVIYNTRICLSSKYVAKGPRKQIS